MFMCTFKSSKLQVQTLLQIIKKHFEYLIFISDN